MAAGALTAFPTLLADIERNRQAADEAKRVARARADRGYWHPHARPVDVEARRREFYARCARAFEFEGWYFPPAAPQDARQVPARKGQLPKKTGMPRPQRTALASVLAPLEELRERHMLQDPLDKPGGADAVDRRYLAGRSLRSLFEGAAFIGLRSADLESGGGGSFSGRVANDHAIDCMRLIEECRAGTPADAWELLEAMLRTENLSIPRNSKGVIPNWFRENVRLALDYAAAWEKIDDAGIRRAGPFIGERAFQRRWPEFVTRETIACVRGASVGARFVTGREF